MAAALARLTYIPTGSLSTENLIPTHVFPSNSQFSCFPKLKLAPWNPKSRRCSSSTWLLPGITPARIGFPSGAGVSVIRVKRWHLVGNEEFSGNSRWVYSAAAGVGRSLICFSGGDSSGDGELSEDSAEGLGTSKSGGGRELSKDKQQFVWRILEGWQVPWDLSVTFLGMVAWVISFVLTGLAVAFLSVYLGFGKRVFLDLERQSLYILVNQILETIFGLGAIFAIVKRYKPLAPDLFTYDWKDPLNVQHGWLLWGAIGTTFAFGAIALASTITSMLLGEPPTREETDALQQLLPIIGVSPTSTVSLIAVTGVLAPLMEETVFRGFLLPSLSKWVSTPGAILLSSSAFAIAHLTPGEFPQLFALGVVLGLTYSQTRNLLTPIAIHSIWNSGVIIVLTVLRLQGYDIQQLI